MASRNCSSSRNHVTEARPQHPRIRHHPWRVARFRWRSARRPVRSYARKFGGDGTPRPTPPSWQVIGISWIGAVIALGGLGGIAELSHAPLVMAPFGASAVLLFAHPDSPLTQPRNVIAGHLIGGIVGLLTGLCLGDSWVGMALGVATTIAIAKATQSVHPPAGATTIVCMHLHVDWSFLLAPVFAGSVLLVLAAALFNNAIEHRRYPRHWW